MVQIARLSRLEFVPQMFLLSHLGEQTGVVRRELLPRPLGRPGARPGPGPVRPRGEFPLAGHSVSVSVRGPGPFSHEGRSEKERFQNKTDPTLSLTSWEFCLCRATGLGSGDLSFCLWTWEK